MYAALIAGALALYSATLHPDVQPADSGEFQIAAITLGIPHPPGYPLFTMLGWLFAQMPFGSPFARVSFLSVIASTATLVLVALAVERIAKPKQIVTVSPAPGGRVLIARPAHLWATLSGILAAIALGASTTFWAQATTTNIRSLTAFFTSLLVYATARVYSEMRSGETETGAIRASSVLLFAVALGLGVGHHASLAFAGAVLGGFMLIAMLRARLSIRVFIVAAFVLAATQLVWLYLPMRDAAGARFAPGNLNTVDGVLYHIFARGFAGDMFAFATPEYLGDRLAILPTLLTFQFSLPVLALAALSLLALLGKRTSIAIALMFAFGLHLFVTLTYRAPQTVEYAMPSWVILCVVLGAGLGALGAIQIGRASWPRAIRRLPYGVLAVLLTVVIARDALKRLPSYVELARDRSTRQLAAGMLDQAAPNATVLAMWHQATPMWALQDVEGIRRDVRVEYVYPRGAQAYAESFAGAAAERASAGPTYVTSYFEPEFARANLYPAPQPGLAAWRINTGAIDPAVAGTPAGFDNGRIQIGLAAVPYGPARAGSPFAVDIFWSATGEIRDGESLTIRLIRTDGRLACNADLRLDASAMHSIRHVRRLVLGVPADLLPGEYFVYAGVYWAGAEGIQQLLGDGGAEFTPLRVAGHSPPEAIVKVLPAAEPPVTRRPQAQLPFKAVDTSAVLVGVDYDTGIPGQLRVLTHWQLAVQSALLQILSAEGQPLTPEQRLPPATQAATPEFLTFHFDVPQWKRLHLVVKDQSSSHDLALPDFVDGERYVAFGNQMALTGAAIQLDGGQVRVDLRWLSARPITTDYIVSARVAGDNLFVTHDSVPALGAIPTLKWIRGSEVTDRHVLDLGSHAGSWIGTVLVYDGFTHLPLPALDERYEQGVVFGTLAR